AAIVAMTTLFCCIPPPPALRLKQPGQGDAMCSSPCPLANHCPEWQAPCYVKNYTAMWHKPLKIIFLALASFPPPFPHSQPPRTETTINPLIKHDKDIVFALFFMFIVKESHISSSGPRNTRPISMPQRTGSMH
ncbi:MAG: hypothetical protein ACYDHV_12915, partial [Desulfurivibrionaceae bacterium]